MKRSLQFFAAIPLAAVFASAQGAADASSAFRFRQGVYRYSIEWRGMAVGSAEIEVGRTNTSETLTMNAETTGVVDWLANLRYRAEAVLDAESEPLRPMSTTIETREGSRRDVSTYDYHADGSLTHRIERHRRRRDVQRETETLSPNEPLIDLVSFVAIARRWDWNETPEREVGVALGAERYRLLLRRDEMTRVKMGGQNREAWTLIPTVYKGDSTEPQTVIRRFRVLVSNDEYREILELRGRSEYGNIRIRLKSFVETGAPARLNPVFSLRPALHETLAAPLPGARR